LSPVCVFEVGVGPAGRAGPPPGQWSRSVGSGCLGTDRAGLVVVPANRPRIHTHVVTAVPGPSAPVATKAAHTPGRALVAAPHCTASVQRIARCPLDQVPCPVQPIMTGSAPGPAARSARPPLAGKYFLIHSIKVPILFLPPLCHSTIRSSAPAHSHGIFPCAGGHSVGPSGRRSSATRHRRPPQVLHPVPTGRWS